MNGPMNFERARPPYVTKWSEGQNFCVIGPRDEIAVEITHGDVHQQSLLAERIAAMLNDVDENHGCNARARRDRAQHFLLLVRQNVIHDNNAMESLAMAVDEAGVEFSRAEIAELVGGVPF